MPAGSAAITAEGVATRLADLRARIAAAGGDPARVAVCAVTKGLPLAAVHAASAVGLADVGENYAQELAAKIDQWAPTGPNAMRWHMIGTLQRNKVKLLAGRVHCWQAVDRVAVGREIARHDPGANIMVQVNSTGESTKGGVEPDEVPSLVEELTGLGLDVTGLMTVGPTDRGQDPRPGFERTAALANDLGLDELSMGMSADLEAAVACGSTMVRVGTALFGPRPTRATSSPAFGG